jgi:pyrimidine-nucleoside phosphorylase
MARPPEDHPAQVSGQPPADAPGQASAVEVIAAKRDGRELAADDIAGLIAGFAAGAVTDSQLAAFLMAGYLQGFSHAETWALTDAMVDSGRRLDLSGLRGPTADQLSTGGVSDATSLVVAPLAASLGMQVLMLSGRGLGHTGSTLDKLEAIPGLRTERTAEELLAQVDDLGVVIGAETADLVPADRAMYALRDATATVGNQSLMAASIMSRKLAAGVGRLVLDVKLGSGALLKDQASARALAALCVAIATRAGTSATALVTDMNQPLGTTIGNAIEVREAIAVLRGERGGRFRQLCLELTGRLAALSGTATDPAAGLHQAERALDGGEALELFARLVESQGGDPSVVDDPARLPLGPVVREVRADRAGWLGAMDTEALGLAGVHLGAGRRRADELIDPRVGIEMPVRLGDRVEVGLLVARIFASDPGSADVAAAAVRSALGWSDEPVIGPPLIYEAVE